MRVCVCVCLAEGRYCEAYRHSENESESESDGDRYSDSAVLTRGVLVAWAGACRYAVYSHAILERERERERESTRSRTCIHCCMHIFICIAVITCVCVCARVCARVFIHWEARLTADTPYVMYYRMCSLTIECVLLRALLTADTPYVMRVVGFGLFWSSAGSGHWGS